MGTPRTPSLVAGPANAEAPKAGAPPAPPASTAREFEELWFALDGGDWLSVVIVPADSGGSSEAYATALAEVGKRLSAGPVTAITASTLDAASARAFADLQELERARRRALRPAPAVDLSPLGIGRLESAARMAPREGIPREIPPDGRIILSIPSVVREPLGLAVARAADWVVVSVVLGRTLLAEARRTVELVGRERVAGWLLVR